MLTADDKSVSDTPARGFVSQQVNVDTPAVSASATTETIQNCDHTIESTGRPCGERARWKVFVFATARMILFRCDRHVIVLERRERAHGRLVEKERVNWSW
jgi:hypothetical protein